MSTQKSQDTDIGEDTASSEAAESQARDAAEEQSRSGKLRHDAQLSRKDAAAYFRALVEGMEQGSMVIRQDDRELTLYLPDTVELELRAADKGEKGKFSFEISWRAPEPPPPRLEIVPGQSE